MTDDTPLTSALRSFCGGKFEGCRLEDMPEEDLVSLLRWTFNSRLKYAIRTVLEQRIR